MKKYLIISILTLILIALIAGGYMWWKSKKIQNKQSEDAIQLILVKNGNNFTVSIKNNSNIQQKILLGPSDNPHFEIVDSNGVSAQQDIVCLIDMQVIPSKDDIKTLGSGEELEIGGASLTQEGGKYKFVNNDCTNSNYILEKGKEYTVTADWGMDIGDSPNRIMNVYTKSIVDGYKKRRISLKDVYITKLTSNPISFTL